MIGGPAALRGSDQGSAAVLVAGVCAVVIVLGAAAVTVTTAAHASARARTVADLSALAGATARLQQLVGTSNVDPCSVAATLAAHNGAALTSCVVEDAATVTVGVSVRAPAMMSSMSGLSATASARAGPAPP